MKSKMKKYLIVLFCIIQIQSYASQIAVGIFSKNVIAWNIWEYNKGKLKHYLYLFNQSNEKIKVEVKLKKFKSDGGTGFEEVKTNKVFFKVKLTSNQILKLSYPEKSDRLDFMEFFENDKRIGLLNFNSDKPNQSFINDKYKFYSNSSFNNGSGIFWIRFESVFSPITEVGIIAKLNPKDYDYYLIKLITRDKETDDGESSWTKLNKLQKSDESIIKLDKSANPYTFKLQRDFEQKKFISLIFIMEFVKDGKMQSAENGRIPIFNIN